MAGNRREPGPPRLSGVSPAAERGSRGTGPIPEDVRAALRVVEDHLLGRWPESRIEPSLDRIRALTDLLGQPQRAYPVIHLTGTNGKTSTSRMIESLLGALGLRTGLYTSPHLHSFLERIRVDGAPIAAEDFLAVHAETAALMDLVDDRSLAEGGPRLTFFEALTALAYASFANAPVDVGIIEVGMGGTWDATNIADGQVAVVTPVGLDHMEYLGDTVAKIAAEKSGIIKPGAIAVLAAQDPSAASVLIERCAQVEAMPVRQGMEFGLADRQVAVGGQLLTIDGLAGRYDEILLPLHGVHQASNASIALAAVEAFIGGGQQMLDIDAVREGFANATSPGRCEILRRSPTIIVDAAHNPHGAAALANTLEESFTFERIIGVVAVFEGKDAVGLLQALEPHFESIVITRNSSPRSHTVEDLDAIARTVFPDHAVISEPDLASAIERAVALADEAGPGSGVVITGSVITAADARALLGRTSV